MREKKTAILLLGMFLLMLVLGGCGTHGATAENTTQQEADTQAVDGEYVMLYLTGLLEEPEEEQSSDPVASTMVATVEGDVTAERIADAYNHTVVESIYGQPMTINDVQQTGGTVKVDFDSKSVEALPIEEGTEGMVFYNLARSIDENLGDVDEIYFTMDGGKDFVLGHLWFECTRPFYSGRAPGDCEDLTAGEVPPEE